MTQLTKLSLEKNNELTILPESFYRLKSEIVQPVVAIVNANIDKIEQKRMEAEFWEHERLEAERREAKKLSNRIKKFFKR